MSASAIFILDLKGKVSFWRLVGEEVNIISVAPASRKTVCLTKRHSLIIFSFLLVSFSAAHHTPHILLFLENSFANLTPHHPDRADRKRSSTCQTRFTDVQYTHTRRACSCAAMQSLLYVMCPISWSKTLLLLALTCFPIKKYSD